MFLKPVNAQLFGPIYKVLLPTSDFSLKHIMWLSIMSYRFTLGQSLTEISIRFTTLSAQNYIKSSPNQANEILYVPWFIVLHINIPDLHS